MPLGSGFLGNMGWTLEAAIEALSQMPLGIGFMGNPHQDTQRPEPLCVTNASRHWVLG